MKTKKTNIRIITRTEKAILRMSWSEKKSYIYERIFKSIRAILIGTGHFLFEVLIYHFFRTYSITLVMNIIKSF